MLAPPNYPTHVVDAVSLALERKARDVVALDLRGISSVTDFFVIATGRSDVQVRAIVERVVEGLRNQGLRPSHVEGARAGRWALADYVDMVVHVFHPDARDFFRLEQLWGDAPAWSVGPGENETTQEREDD